MWYDNTPDMTDRLRGNNGYLSSWQKATEKSKILSMFKILLQKKTQNHCGSSRNATIISIDVNSCWISWIGTDSANSTISDSVTPTSMDIHGFTTRELQIGCLCSNWIPNQIGHIYLLTRPMTVRRNTNRIGHNYRFLIPILEHIKQYQRMITHRATKSAYCTTKQS